MNINYSFTGYQADQDLLYFDDMMYHTCVCMYESTFTVEGLINKIKLKTKLKTKEKRK